MQISINQAEAKKNPNVNFEVGSWTLEALVVNLTFLHILGQMLVGPEQQKSAALAWVLNCY